MTDTCQRPPAGWACTRDPDHDGPCAAVPAAHTCHPTEDAYNAACRALEKHRDRADRAVADLAEARRLIANYENAINWMTSCTRCALLLDGLYATEPLKDLARWLVALDEPGNQDRPTVTLNRIIDRARDALTYLPHAEPRTWALPPEPGPDVKVLRDKDGDLLYRTQTPDRWWNNPHARTGLSWHDLLGYAPLTDATNDPEATSA